MIAENNAKRGDRWNLDDGGFWRMGREAPGAPQKKIVEKIMPSQLCKRIKLADTATDPTAKVRGSKLVDTATNTPSQLCTRIKLADIAVEQEPNSSEKGCVCGACRLQTSPPLPPGHLSLSLSPNTSGVWRKNIERFCLMEFNIMAENGKYIFPGEKLGQEANDY